MKHFVYMTVILLFFISGLSSQDNRDMNLNIYINDKVALVPTFTDYSALSTTATWTTLPVSPHAVSRSCCVIIRRNDTNYVYQFGGGSGTQFTNVARFNVTTNTWTNNVSTMPHNISAGYAIADGDSVIYVLGGESTGGLGRTLKWVIATNTWTNITGMPTPATDMQCVKYQDTLIIAIGGGDGLFGTTVFNAVRLFRMRSATWQTCSPLPVALSMMCGGIWRDTIIVTGGWNGTGGSATTYKGVIDPSNPTNITWTSALPPYPPGGMTRAASHFVRKDGGVGIAISGGAVGGSTVSNSTNLWNFCTQSWQSLPPNSQARSNLRGTGLNDSIFYIIGGYTTMGVGTSERLTFSFITGTCGVVGINTNENGIPYEYSLLQNYPNPFNPSTTITYGLPKNGFVKISVRDILGRELAVIVNEYKNAGVHNIEFDASGLASGIYFYTLSAGEQIITRKMLLIK